MVRSKNSFVLYTDSRNLIELLSDEQSGRLFKAIFSYIDEGEAPELDNVSMMAFVSIKSYLDRDQAKYEAVCQKRAEYGKRGGLAKASKSKHKLASVADSDSDTDTDSDSDINISPTKPVKHKQGKYNNVLLTDEELEKLKKKYSDWENKIDVLSEGLALKGYKYKSHYLAVIKWAEGNKKGGADSVPTQRDGYEDFI